MKNLLLIICAGIICFQIACSGPAENEGSAFDPKVDEFDNLIAGPTVEGKWTSECLADPYSRKYKIRSIEFKGNTFVRNDNTYSDNSCKLAFKVLNVQGRYRWSEVTRYGGFVLDYKINLTGGWTQSSQEELLIEDENLYLSDFMVGFGSISKIFPMRKIKTAGVIEESPMWEEAP